MKVLYHHRIASKDGQYVHVSEILNSMDKAGVDVRIVSPRVTDSQHFGSEGGIVSKLKSSFASVFFMNVWSCLTHCSILLSWLQRYVSSALMLSMNAITSTLSLEFLASKLFRIPLILEVNAPLYDERLKYNGLGLPRLARWIEEYTWKNADYLLPVTEVLAKRLLQVEGVERDRIEVVANGINSTFLQNEAEAKRLPQLADDQIVVGFVGFCREWHQLDRVLSVLAEPQKPTSLLLTCWPRSGTRRSQKASCRAGNRKASAFLQGW